MNDVREDERNTRDGHEQRPRPDETPVRDREHEQADEQPERAAARQRRDQDQQHEAERERERPLPPLAARHAQIHGNEREQRHDEHDPEMVRVARQRVRPVDARARDLAVDVDRARAAGERREHGRIEVVPRARSEQLQHAVHAVRGEPCREPAERAPVEAFAALHEVRHARGEEEEVQDELHHPLRELVERLLRLEVEEAEQVHQKERGEEREHDRARPRPARPGLQRERAEEEDRQDIGDADGAGDVPVHLLERHAEERREEQESATRLMLMRGSAAGRRAPRRASHERACRATRARAASHRASRRASARAGRAARRGSRRRRRARRRRPHRCRG